MSLVRWDPWREMEGLVDRYARTLGRPRTAGHEAMATGEWAPAVDVSETEKEFLIKADIPEVKKEDVKVTVNEDILVIQGERKQEKEEKGKKFHKIERSYGSFVRSFTLPDNVAEDKIAAEFKEGVLSLHLPKTEKPKAKGMEIEVK